MCVNCGTRVMLCVWLPYATIRDSGSLSRNSTRENASLRPGRQHLMAGQDLSTVARCRLTPLHDRGLDPQRVPQLPRGPDVLAAHVRTDARYLWGAFGLQREPRACIEELVSDVADEA